ncbi:glycoside hydrolase family 61 protein [Rhizoctonia solani AG-3 Rhs1AP]|uniref:lytic cellulose monooxygenase (C4-dehydrogenating) n=1 Tax=Rhizoctonia solani AG-3 Rhs1AP TaxID=1086054 RepID=X8JAP9_9AGAM|nr:glycoside hydrolase family 61 protein [Rhizoctonia solani AG-3 Rhs1AP]
MRSVILVTSLSCAASVLAHGYVQQLKIGSQYVPTWNPYKDPQQKVTRITRAFKDNGPIPDGFTSAITCNVGKTADTQNIPVNATAIVPAGTTVDFLWTDWQSDHPGPIMTYLAKCPGSCSTFKADSGNIWVKIQEDGYDATKNPPWASKRLPTVNSTWSATIPKTLQNGEYILRHEILGLQRATESGRAQFYPACHQITVTNGGTKALPTGIAIPGNYTLTDPGVRHPTIF